MTRWKPLWTLIPGSRLDADHPENGVLIPCRNTLRVVGEWTTRRRRAEKTDVETLRRIPSARTIARLMTVGRDTLSKAETVTVAAVEAGVPPLVEAREIIAEFHMMIRRRAAADDELGALDLLA